MVLWAKDFVDRFIFWKAVRGGESFGKRTATGLLIFTKYVVKISQNNVERVSNILFN